MSVGFNFRGNVKGFTFGRYDKEMLINKLKLFLQNKESIIPGFVTEFTAYENEINVFIYPTEEPLNITFDDEYVYCKAITSGAGPGYHYYLINFTKEMGRVVGINWFFNDYSAKFGDDTMYDATKSIEDVMAVMASWLQRVIEILGDKTGAEGLNGGFNISLPNEIMPTNHEEIWYPLGKIKMAWVENNKDSIIDVFEDNLVCRSFFPWWNKEMDALFYFNLATTLMWYCCPWRKPCNDTETTILNKISACMEKAYEIDENLEFPWVEWIEVAYHLGDIDYADILKERFTNSTNQHITDNPIGFRRGKVYQLLKDDWRVVLDGDMSYFEDINGKTFTKCGRIVRASTLTAEYKDNTPITKEELIDMEDNFTYKNFSFLESKGITSKIFSSGINKYNDILMYNIQFKAAIDGNILYISIYYVDESDITWALETLASIYNESIAF